MCPDRLAPPISTTTDLATAPTAIAQQSDGPQNREQRYRISLNELYKMIQFAFYFPILHLSPRFESRDSQQFFSASDSVEEVTSTAHGAQSSAPAMTNEVGRHSYTRRSQTGEVMVDPIHMNEIATLQILSTPMTDLPKGRNPTTTPSSNKRKR